MKTFEEKIDLGIPEQKDIELEIKKEDVFGDEVGKIKQKEQEKDYDKEKDYGEELIDRLKKVSSEEETYAQEIIKDIKIFQTRNPEKYEEALKMIKKTGSPFDPEYFSFIQALPEECLEDKELLNKVYQSTILKELSLIDASNPPEEMWRLIEKSIVKRNQEVHAHEISFLLKDGLSEEDYKVLDRINEIEIKGDTNIRFGEFNQSMLIYHKNVIYEILSNDKKFENISNKINQLKEIFENLKIEIKDIPNLLKMEIDQNYLKTFQIFKEKYNLEIDRFSELEFYLEFSKENIEIFLSDEFTQIKEDIKNMYNLRELNSVSELKDWLVASDEEIKKIYSEEFKNKIEKIEEIFHFKEDLFWKIQAWSNVSDEQIEQLLSPVSIKILKLCKFEDGRDLRKFIPFLENISKNGEKIEKILSDFGIEEIDIRELRVALYFSEEKINKIIQGDFFDYSFKEEMEPWIKKTSFYKQIFEQFTENIRKTKGDYQANTFSKDLLKNISSSLTFSYLSFKNSNEENLEKLKEKSLGSETHKKIYNKASSGVLELKDVIPGRKATKKMIEKGNLEYLLISPKLDIPFDYYGILGKDIEEMKKEIDEKGEELLENYSENKERYLPYLDSLLGYASKHKEEVRELLKIEDLWKFKFSHLEDLNSILSEVKDLEMEIGESEGEAKDNIEIYVKNLEEHLEVEEFSKAEQRVSVIKEKNQEKALDLIKKAENIIAELLEGKNPEKKEIDILLSNKAIFKHLDLTLSLESIRQMYQKINQGEKEEEFLKSVEIIKEPEEYLGAMNMDPSCMRVGGGFDYGAITIAQAPILILGVKDNFGKIKGRSLLIPVKDKNGKYRFELKNTYGAGEEHIEDFAEKIEYVLREKENDYYKEIEKIVTRDFIDGELPKTKKLPSTRDLEFYRDGGGLVEFEEVN